MEPILAARVSHPRATTISHWRGACSGTPLPHPPRRPGHPPRPDQPQAGSGVPMRRGWGIVAQLRSFVTSGHVSESSRPRQSWHVVNSAMPRPTVLMAGLHFVCCSFWAWLSLSAPPCFGTRSLSASPYRALHSNRIGRCLQPMLLRCSPWCFTRVGPMLLGFLDQARWDMMRCVMHALAVGSPHSIQLREAE